MSVEQAEFAGLDRGRVVKLLRFWRRDPAAFCEQLFGDVLWLKQREILRALAEHDRVAVQTGHGAGKTYTAARAFFWHLVCFPGSVSITTAPSFRQVRSQLWREILNVHTALTRRGVTLGAAPLQTEFSLDKKWYGQGVTSRDPEAFSGYHGRYVLVVVDEASGVDEGIFDAIEGIMASGNARLLLIGNPSKPTGYFADALSSPDFRSIHVSAFDTPNFTELGITRDDIRSGAWESKTDGKGRQNPWPNLVRPRWVAGRYRDWGEDDPRWLVRVEGLIAPEDEDVVIPPYLVDVAYEGGIEPRGECVFGIDWADEGESENVIAVRRGGRLVDLVSHRCDAMEAVGHVVNAVRRERPHRIVSEKAGLGTPAHRRLAEMLETIGQEDRLEAFEPAGEAKDSETYANAAAEMWYDFRSGLRRGEVDLSDFEGDGRLRSQLITRRPRTMSDGRTGLDRKDQLKGRGHESPDRADAVLIAYYQPAGSPGSPATLMYGRS